MAEGQREKERENLKQALCCQLRAGLWARSHKLWDHDRSRNQESDTQPTEPPRRPPRTWILETTHVFLLGVCLGAALWDLGTV